MLNATALWTEKSCGDKFALQLAPGSMQFFSSTSLSVLEKACGDGIGGAETTKLSANNVTSREIRCIRNQKEGKAEEGELEGSLD